MNQRPRKYFTSFGARLLICFASVLSLNGPSAWGEDSNGRSYSLQAIIDLALTHNPAIEYGKGVIEEKQGDQISAGAYPNPTFDLQSGQGRVLDPTGLTLTERYFSLSQPLEWPGTRAARQHAAAAEVTGAQAGFEGMQLNVKANVKRTFYELLLARTLADLASRLLTTVTNLEQAATRRVNSGEAPPIDLVKVKVELLQSQNLVSQTQGSVRTNKVALNNLTSGKLGEVFAIQGDFVSVKNKLDEQNLIHLAFQHHPEVRRFQQLIEVAGAQHNQEQHARVPNVTVTGGYQRDAGREGFVGALSVPLPIWDQRQGELAKTLGVRRQAEANLRQAQISLKKGITEQVQISRTAAAQIHTFEQGLLKQAQEAVRIAQTSFKFGEAGLPDVLDAQRVLWETYQGYAQARFELSVALTELERLVGKEL